MPSQRVFHIVSHTHWDREWYISFASFQARLVLMLDNLLEILERDPGYRQFHLDGQTIVLEDYLAVKPEKADVIRRLVQQNRLHIGPWYTATDETLVSGESLVRNLLIGMYDCARFGPASLVGYLPDQFGHIAQLPQILHGFGVKSVVLGRGINRGQHKNEFRWVSPDGSEVFGLFLNTWYSNARNIPSDPMEAAAYLNQAAEKAAQFSTTPHLLLMNGVDHMEAQPNLGTILKETASWVEGEIVHDSLAGAVAATRAAAGDTEAFHGELREDLGGRLDAGTLSARMPLKIANFYTTRMLEKVAEPLAAYARVAGGPDLSALLMHAWRILLQNHPHDSICGCSIDEVALQMTARFHSATDLGYAVAERAMQALAPALGYTDQPGEALVYNPAPVARRGVHILTVDLPLAEPTRSAVDSMRKPERNHGPLKVQVTLANGNVVPAQLLDVAETERLVLAPLNLPRTQPVQRARFAVELDLPEAGIQRIAVQVKPATTLPPVGLASSARRMENEHLMVEVGTDDALWVQDKNTGKRFGPMHVVEDGGDCGDTYHYIAPQRDRVLLAARAASVELVENGPLCAAIRLRYELATPQGLDAAHIARTMETAPLVVETVVRLRKGSALLTFTTTVTNSSDDHRVRVLFPTGAKCAEVTSGSQFAAVSRPVVLPTEWIKAATARPQWGWTDASANGFGVTIMAQGITETEPLPGPEGVTIALTLLRCVGAVSRSTATPLVIPAPEAQCKSTYQFNYALYLHTGDWRESRVPAVWEGYAAEPIVFQPRPASETTGANAPLVECNQPFAPFTVDNPHFVVSAIKLPVPKRDGQAPFTLILRGYSVAAKPLQTTVKFAQAPAKVLTLDLAENVLAEMPIHDGAVTFAVKPAQIVTLGLVMAPNAEVCTHE